MSPERKYFLPYQAAVIEDASNLIVIEKSRQIGMSYAVAYKAVRLVSQKGNRLDVWVSSRDDAQARLFLDDCKGWARLLNLAANDLGEMLFDKENDFSAYVLEFASGLRIYSLSSNPNALAGKRGHVVLDEFALHQDQRLLYRVAKPVTTWGGQLIIISTHRGMASVFNEIIRDIKEKGNPMGWSLHTITLQSAVEQGLVERINAKTGRTETNDAYLKRIRAECLDVEQWQQEYCCRPSDDATAFITYELITACEADCMKDIGYLRACANPLYLGMDVGRKKDLTVIDVGEKIGDVLWDRVRIELQNKSFSEQREVLWDLLRLPQLKRACLDATGLGMQLAEEARAQFGWKVEPITFTGPVKEELAFALRAAFEDKTLRIARDPNLHADLRGIRKQTTTAGNIRFTGESEDSHCDRFWAKALRHHASMTKSGMGAAIGV